MTDSSRNLMDLMFPGILLVFLGLYGYGLMSQVEPEFALVRAGAAGILLAGLARLGCWIIESASGSKEAAAESGENQAVGRRLDVAIGDAETTGDAPESTSPSAADTRHLMAEE